MTRDREYVRAYQRQWMARRRAATLGGMRCAICGSDDGLQLHHVDKASKVTHRFWSFAEGRRKEELAKCIPLCRSCHVQLHAEERRVDHDHGTNLRYTKQDCRCRACRDAHAAAAREYRHKQEEPHGQQHHPSA